MIPPEGAAGVTDWACAVVAQHALASALNCWLDDDGWERYPEVGENDWLKIESAIQQLITYPDPGEYQAACRHLEGRAER